MTDTRKLADLIMNALGSADYYVDTSSEVPRISPSPEILERNEISEAIQNLTKLCNQYYACVWVAERFREYPWLGGFSVQVEVQSEYNDEGGYYDYTSVQVSNVYATEGQAIPEDLAAEVEQDDGFGDSDEDGAGVPEVRFELDSNMAEDMLSDEFNDNSEVFGDALSLSSGDSYTMTFNRHDMEDLLKNKIISGKIIFDRIGSEFDQ